MISVSSLPAMINRAYIATDSYCLTLKDLRAPDTQCPSSRNSALLRRRTAQRQAAQDANARHGDGICAAE